MNKVCMLRRKGLGKKSCDGIKAAMKGDVTVVRSDKLTDFSKYDYVIRWGTTTAIGTSSPSVLNAADAIHKVNNKREFRRVLQEHNLCPKTWFNLLDYRLTVIGPTSPENACLPKPVVVRPAKHAQGKSLFLCNTVHNLIDAITAIYTNSTEECHYYISEFVPKIKEFRVFVVQGRVAWVAEKIPDDPTKPAWNVAQGSKFENVKWGDWSLPAVRYALDAMLLSGLDFGGVDIIVDSDGEAFVLEINSAASQTSPYRQSCVAKCFDHIVEHGKATIEPVVGHSYKGYIHPAISEKAVVAP